ncbi:MAG: oligosaccharide flippase family protein [Nitrososphaerota archaeon]|nr:oligosaccharide flippase family protein [Nitrososphaerota archaeon]MDG7024405.1 oligosaccharide flippase family protein [Nitrososphaerota archaeon]
MQRDKDEAPPGRPARARNIVRGIGFLSIQGVLSAFLGFVLLGSLLRFLPSLSYGAFSALQVSIGIAGTLSIFGVNAAVVRFLAPAASQEGASGWGLAKASLGLTIIFSTVVSLVLVIAAPYLSDYFMKSPSWSWVFYLGALWLLTSSVATVFQGMLQAVRKYSLLAKVLLASRAVSVVFAVIGLVVFQSLAAAILSWVVYSVLIIAVALATTWRPLLAASSKQQYSRILRYAVPLGMAAVVASLASSADIVVVGGYLNPISLGVYNATVVISSVVSSLFVAPLSTALFAETSFSSETHAEVSRGVSLALRFVLLTVLPVSLFAAAVAPQLFYLFSGGGTFAEGIPYLELITLFYLFLAAETTAIYVLQGVGKTRQVLIIGLITALGEIGLSVSLVPFLGLEGAAISRVTIFIVGCALSLYYIRSYLKGATNFRFLAKAVVSGGIPGAVVFALSSVVSNRVLTLVPYTILGVLIFFGCARVLRLFSEEDRSFVVHLLPSRMEWIVRLL